MVAYRKAQVSGSGSSGLNRFIWAIRQQESGGNYHAVNSSSGALGAYQIMPANISAWSKAALGYSITPQQFLSNPRYQDEIARHQLGGYYNSYGPRGAAAAWYSGQPNPNARYGNPPVYQYVNDVMALMGRAPNSLGRGGSVNSGGGGTPAQTTAGVPFWISPGGWIIQHGSSGIAQGIGSGIAFGLETTFNDVLKAWWVRLKWLFYMYAGITGMLTSIGVAIIWWMTDKILSNPQAVGAVVAAPETGGASLLMGARGALGRERRERQSAAETRAEARLQLAQQRAARGATESTERIGIARRRVGVQEQRESRLAAASVPPPIPAATRTSTATAAGSRAKQLAERRKQLIAQGFKGEELRKKLLETP